MKCHWKTLAGGATLPCHPWGIFSQRTSVKILDPDVDSRVATHSSLDSSSLRPAIVVNLKLYCITSRNLSTKLRKKIGISQVNKDALQERARQQHSRRLAELDFVLLKQMPEDPAKNKVGSNGTPKFNWETKEESWRLCESAVFNVDKRVAGRCRGQELKEPVLVQQGRSGWQPVLSPP